MDKLCEEIIKDLKLVRSQASEGRLSDWHQRMERSEESWESMRQQIFECVIANEALPDCNVRKWCSNMALLKYVILDYLVDMKNDIIFIL